MIKGNEILLITGNIKVTPYLSVLTFFNVIDDRGIQVPLSKCPNLQKCWFKINQINDYENLTETLYKVINPVSLNWITVINHFGKRSFRNINPKQTLKINLTPNKNEMIVLQGIHGVGKFIGCGYIDYEKSTVKDIKELNSLFKLSVLEIYEPDKQKHKRTILW